MRAHQFALAVAALLLFFGPGTSWAASGRLGLPAVHELILPPSSLESPVRAGFSGYSASIDPAHGIEVGEALGPSIHSRGVRFWLSLRATPNLRLAIALPWRSISTDGADKSGWGDLRVGGSLRAWSSSRLMLGSFGVLSIPMRSTPDALGTGELEGEAGLNGQLLFFENSLAPPLRWSFNAGYRWNQLAAGYGAADASGLSGGVWPPRYPGVTEGQNGNQNDAILLRTAVSFQRRWVQLSMEVSSAWTPSHNETSFQEGEHWFTPHLALGREGGLQGHLAWAIALGADDADTSYEPRLPDWAASAGISFPWWLGGRDRDDDGIPDSEDACPDEPEDHDGFEDEDGCPERDNDGDGIPDRRDLAPMLPEDFDGFEDHDGRPDLDNDLDGIPDEIDQCPRQAEDFDGFEDTDGCPDVVLDADGDGIEDALDRCPLEAEDMDGFEDGDGCPEPDNDLDGIPDSEDACPNEPEDYDGDNDRDGCPDS